MSIETMELARYALKELVAQTEGRFFSIKHDHHAMQDARSAIRRLDEAIAKQEKEDPFGGYSADDLNNAWKSGYDNCKDQKPWVGLTDEEIEAELDKFMSGASDGYVPTFVKFIEAKLKEKNT